MDPARNRLLQELLAGCARKDQGAFARLYELTAPKLFGVAVRILRREDWAEEVVQDCFVNVWNHAGSYSAGRSAPMTWMTSIVRNRCLDWLRRPSPEVVLVAADDEADDPLEALPSDDRGPLDELARSADAQALADCLRRLDAKQRQAIMLAFYDGLSHSELASHLRQPLGTVKTWVRRGLERLKGCLGTM
jgi:RNA polymerase sigma-70 factor (ECF subfamily)